MSVTMLSHTFAQTVNLTRFESAGDRHHYRTDDGRNIVAKPVDKPVDNPAYLDGLRYYEASTPVDVEAWMAPGRDAALRELSASFAAATAPMATHLPESALDPAPEGWEDYELVNAAQRAADNGYSDFSS